MFVLPAACSLAGKRRLPIQRARDFAEHDKQGNAVQLWCQLGVCWERSHLGPSIASEACGPCWAGEAGVSSVAGGAGETCADDSTLVTSPSASPLPNVLSRHVSVRTLSADV